jgi:Winged helix-turn-helix domain (DUF2582)
MAKGKATKPVKETAAKPTKSAKKVADHLEVSRGFKPEPAAARTPGALSDVEIGHVAGDVWGVLTRDSEMTIAAIKKAVPAPGDVVMAAIGWLAREHKLVFTAEGRSVKISLR